VATTTVYTYRKVLIYPLLGAISLWLTSAFGLKSEALDVASHLPFRLAAGVLIGIHTSVYGYKRMVNRKKTTFDDLWILTCIQSGYH